MSVRVNQRRQNKLAVLSFAKELASYTVKICSNENNFPKRYRWTMTSDIIHEALAIATCISEANGTPLTKEFAQERRKYQYKAAAHVSALYTLVDVSYGVFDLDCIEYWTSLIDRVDEKLSGWIKSDQQRLNK